MRYSILLLAAFCLFQLSANPAKAQAVRGLGGASLVLDDGLGHTITIETPKPGDAGYDAWLLGGGTSVWKLPIPPFADANAGFVLPGTAANQILVWVPAPDGGPQGAWEPVDGATFIADNGGGGGGGGVSGSGTTGNIPIWTGSTSLGNSGLTDDATTLTYSGPNINSTTDYQIGGTTIITAPGTGNIFVGQNGGVDNTGSNNATLGSGADIGNGGGPTVDHSVAIGADAYVEQSNSIVLGSWNAGGEGGLPNTNVGIGTSTPAAALDVWNNSGDGLYLTINSGDDIEGDSWFINNSGQLDAGGYNGPVSNAVVTLDNGHLASMQNNSPTESVSSTDDMTFNSFGCGSTDVAGLVDFSINNTTTGQYLQVIFNSAYSGSEAVTITPANSATAQNMNLFYVNAYSGYFLINVVNTESPHNGDYAFYYHVIDLQCGGGPTNTGKKSPN